MTLLAAREFAGRGARVNTIVAGGFDPPILDVTGREAAAGQIQLFANPRRPGTSEEFAALAAHIVENGFFNAATPRLDAGRLPGPFVIGCVNRAQATQRSLARLW
jgi:3-hydroxyacyl-CoA dehydrogenase/3-hydroxy-2-methylbutyryl-CoA dehydrogenase